MSSRKKFSAADRVRLAQEYLASSETQAAFAARVGVCPRALRNWIRRYSPQPPSGTATRGVVLRAVRALRDCADSLEAGLAAICVEYEAKEPVGTAASPKAPDLHQPSKFEFE